MAAGAAGGAADRLVRGTRGGGAFGRPVGDTAGPVAGQAEAEGRLALLAPGTVSVGDEGMCVPRNELPAPPPPSLWFATRGDHGGGICEVSAVLGALPGAAGLGWAAVSTEPPLASPQRLQAPCGQGRGAPTGLPGRCGRAPRGPLWAVGPAGWAEYPARPVFRNLRAERPLRTHSLCCRTAGAAFCARLSLFTAVSSRDF